MIPFSLVCALCFFSFTSVLSLDQNEIWMEKLAARVDALETKVADQNNVILELREELFETKQQLKQGQLKDEEQVTQDSADVDKSESTAHTENKPSAIIQSVTPTVTKHAIQKENSPMRRFVTQNSQPVAFHAYFIATGFTSRHVTGGQAIAFPDVDLNLGGGYHSSTGLFIAPAAGVYIFSSNVFQGGTEEIELGLFVNGDRRDGIFTKGRLQGSATVTTQLKIGDEVLVKMLWSANNDARFWGDRLTSFTGCLITPL